MEFYRLKIVLILTVGFFLASLLGYLTEKVRLSPLLGYLIGGYLIGPYSPGFEADVEVSEQLAEIGVILMMFGVGLHFKWEELSSVKRIAVPGAIGQTLVSTIAGCLLMYGLGWSIEAGIIIGVAIGVASTVVLVRVLSDNNMLNTPQGHVTIGWLIVEDLLTVVALIMLPIVVEFMEKDSFSFFSVAYSVAIIMLKLAILGGLVFTVGRKFVTFVLSAVARTRSHELFTITLLALTFSVALGASYFFGTSIALGAFLAGMLIGRTDLRHQALANSLALKDVFVVIFFLSIGMLFNPAIIVSQPLAFIGILMIVLFVKPLVAYVIVIAMRYPFKTAITVAIALGQIGEFSFILAEESSRLEVLSDDGYDLIVASALVSIALNPIFFRYMESIAGSAEQHGFNPERQHQARVSVDNTLKAIVVGFGPVGKGAVRALAKLGYTPVVIDRNIDTVTKLNIDDPHAIYGDASHEEILLAAHIGIADLVVITVPEMTVILSIIHAIREINPTVQILARSSYKSEEHLLRAEGIHFVSSEEELVKAFSHAVFRLTDSYSRGYTQLR